jgi:3-isopropylmalate/(R)-2-methylmalate dehydratase small subunit
MQAFTTLQGPAAALLQPNIDTDVIIRIERLTSVERDALGPFALEALRLRRDGSEDPDFVLNRAPFRDAPILLTGPNFGCGSSREGAVWALLARGVRCVIGESFGDIFFANCFQNGVLALRQPRETVARVAKLASDGLPLTVDLASQRLVLPTGESIAFEVDPMRRAALLEGLDDIGQTLKQVASISAWQAQDRRDRPWVWGDTGVQP